jgi:ankyrin repeat protein
MSQDLGQVITTIARGDVAGLAAALDQGIDADAQDGLGVGLLAHAAAKGKAELLRLLLDRGAQVDGGSPAGNTALMAAAARGHLEAMTLLLEAGADPAAANRWGLGAADWAAWPDNSAEVLNVLRAYLR